jgi:hypothetical protein
MYQRLGARVIASASSVKPAGAEAFNESGDGFLHRLKRLESDKHSRRAAMGFTSHGTLCTSGENRIDPFHSCPRLGLFLPRRDRTPTLSSFPSRAAGQHPSQDSATIASCCRSLILAVFVRRP